MYNVMKSLETKTQLSLQIQIKKNENQRKITDSIQNLTCSFKNNYLLALTMINKHFKVLSNYQNSRTYLTKRMKHYSHGEQEEHKFNNPTLIASTQTEKSQRNKWKTIIKIYIIHFFNKKTSNLESSSSFSFILV